MILSIIVKHLESSYSPWRLLSLSHQSAHVPLCLREKEKEHFTWVVWLPSVAGQVCVCLFSAIRNIALLKMKTDDKDMSVTSRTGNCCRECVEPEGLHVEASSSASVMLWSVAWNIRSSITNGLPRFLELASISKSKRSLSSIVRLLSDNISSLWWWHMSVFHGQNFGDACKLLSYLCILCYFIPYINTNILKSSDSVLSNIIVSGPFLLIISVKNVSHLLTIVLMQD